MKPNPMNRRSPRPRRLCLILAFGLIALLPTLAAAESVKFTFNPPTPLTFRETVLNTRSDEGPGGQGREITISTTSEIELVRKGDGYKMTIRPEPPMEIRGGQQAPMQSNPLMQAIENAVFTYTLDADGRMLSVTGYEEVLARVRQITDALQQQLPDAQRERFTQATEAVRQMLTPEALLNRMRAEWGGRVADFAGAELEIGETLISESDFPLPYGGTVRYFNAVKLEEMVPCDSGQCARIAYRYNTDPSALEEFVGRTLEGMGGPAPTEARIWGGGSRLIDPETLLIQSETQRRTIVMSMQSRNGRTFTVEREETREYSYDYNAAAPTGAPAD